MTMADKESVAQLLKETIVQLCKANIFYSGQVEIDGIICISGQVEGQELVIKVHEIFATPQDLRNPYAAITCQPLAAKFSDFQNLYGDYHRQELKRRRLENSFDFRPAFAYSYLSKLVYGQKHPNTFTQPGLDQRNGATDLSIKSSLAVSSNHWADLKSDGSLSPYQGAETKYDVRDELQPLQTPVRSLLGGGGKTGLPLDGCVPGKSLSSLLPQCRVCFCSFESAESLSDHNELAHSVFTCLCCFKTFTSRSNLERHSRLHTGHRPFTCDVCGKSFSRKDHLSNHAAKHAFKCGACSHRCADRAALVLHCLHDHGAALTNVCAFCNKGFCSAEPYEEHLKSHPQCNAADDDAKVNTEPAGSKVVAARSLSKDRYSCTSCNFETNDKVSVAKHRLVHSSELRLYTCKGCGKIYEDPLQYSDHLILHQKERDIFECCICRQVCGTLSSLRRHEAAHVSDDNSDMEAVAEDDCFRCRKCGRTFETLQFLQEHLDVHELAEQRQSCHLYQKPYEDQVDLDPSAKEGQGLIAPEETNNCVEECCSGAVDVASRRDKRKQKQPKPAVNLSSEMVGAGESDIEVAGPRSPGVREDEKGCDFVVTDNPTFVIQVSGDVEKKVEPAKSILNRTATPVVSIMPRNDPAEPEDRVLSCLLPTKLEIPEETIERDRGSVENRVRLPAKHRGRGKGRHRVTHTSRSSHLAGLLENRISPGGSPGFDNNNSMGVRNENLPLGGDVPPGPFVCVLCGFEADTFQALDGHCVTSHSRSPCMFCAKTFAQKANRDRHHCLHTGDKPYGCPECGEKFSRGDKLKMHRVRAHGIQYPLYGSRHKDASSRDREFASSSPGFLSLQSDGFSPMTSAGYLTGLPALPAFESHEPDDDDDADLRTSNIIVEDADELGRHVSEFPRINSELAKNWKTEKKGSIHWMKTQPKEPEVDEENNILKDVAPIN